MVDMAKLKARHDEELKDVTAYKEMATQCPDYSQIFETIAKQEGEHAKLIEYIMGKMA